MREYWLNFDSRVVCGEDYTQRIAIVNPEALREVSAKKLWERISGNFGKYEFEMWVAEVIVFRAVQALAERTEVAELVPIASGEFQINDDFPEQNWMVYKNSKSIKQLFKQLPIFEIVKEDNEEILLKYII